jgi:hypothetical protein
MPHFHAIRPSVRRFAGPALVLLAAALATAPLFLRGVSCGDDFDFHLISWFDAQQSWRHGLFYPHWTPSANFGAGEPRFVFYPPLTWMLGAALGFVLPWSLVPIAMIFLLLSATGLATRTFARQGLADGPATLAGCATLFCGYDLFTAYERSAFGELSGGFWIPLLFLYALRDRNPSASPWRRALDSSALPLTLVLAGCWLSNAPLGVMASYLLAAVALVSAWQERSWAPLLRASIAAVLGIGLTAFYLIPAACEQGWVDIRQAVVDPGLVIENNWLFAHNPNPALVPHNAGLHRVSIVAVLMIAVALGSALVGWLRGSLPCRRRWRIPLTLVPLAVLFLVFPVSRPVWNALPKLRFLQFPWRWLVALEAPMAVFFASAVWCRQRRRRWIALAACTLLFLGSTAAAARYFFYRCDETHAVAPIVASLRSGAGADGTDEYQAPGSDRTMIAIGLPDACFVREYDVELGVGATADADPVWRPEQRSCEATASWQTLRPERMRLTIATAHPGYLILRLLRYPAWRVKVNGTLIADLPHRDDGLMAIPVPQDTVDLTVDWTAAPDAVAGRWLGGLAALSVVGLGLLERSLHKPGSAA